MDKLIYTAMTGAKQFMERQATVSNNLANVNTTGFKSQIDSLKAIEVNTSPLGYAAQVVSKDQSSDFTPGSIIQTGRALDLAIEGDSWFSVENNQGVEGFTRSGNFKISENGVLQTASGLVVQGENGPIKIQNDAPIIVDKDGVISYLTPGGSLQTQTIIDRLKMVSLERNQLVRGKDGLFYSSFEPKESSGHSKVLSGYLEASNVNIVDAMVNMLNLSKQYDLQIEMIKTAQTNDARSSQIMTMN